MNFQLVIANKENKFFSGVKTNSPKMINNLKELCKSYDKSFGEGHKVRRVILTQKGYKFI